MTTVGGERTRFANSKKLVREVARPTPKGVEITLRFYVYPDGTGHVLSPDGAKPLNSPEKAIAWFAEAWEELHREASKRHRKN